MKPQPGQARRAPNPERRPPLPNFDTMGTMEMLMKAGFAQGQAGAIVEAVRDTQSELATKADMEKLRTDLRGDMEKLRTDLRGDISEQFTKLYWRFLVGAGVVITMITGILGATVTLIGGK